MPFPRDIREDAFVRSRRYCCVCNQHAGRDVEVHHIVPEADGGASTLDNAIALCLECHAEAGHYNPRHPRGTKYSPSELRRLRDVWWNYCENGYRPEDRPAGFSEPLGSGRGVPVQSRDTGILWSRRADISVTKESLQFEARLLADDRFEELESVRYCELFARSDGTFFVYVRAIHRGDWCEAWLDGAPPDSAPLTLDELHDRYRSLATAAGLHRVRRL
jgi:hypothetical protein